MDDDCPDKFKILVNDRIRAFYKVESARKALFKIKETSADLSATKSDQAFSLCQQAVNRFKENRLIFEELDYYKEHKEILGHHPIFTEEVRQREIDEMSLNNAHKALRNIRTYISKEKRAIKNAKTDQNKKQAEAKLKDWEERLKLIEIKIEKSNK